MVLGLGFTVKQALPSLVTLSALCCGVTAIHCAVNHDFKLSCLFLSLAGIFDGLDGHVARLLNAASLFGAELDSLCDLVDFGVAPALVIHIWAAQFPSDNVSDGVLWGCCLLFLCGCACRLARFNLKHAATAHTVAAEVEVAAATEDEKLLEKAAKELAQAAKSKNFSKLKEKPRYYVMRSKFFQGTPAPAAGGLALMPMVWFFQFGSFPTGVDPRAAAAINLVVIALLMVSSIPTLSSKMLMRDPRRESHLRSRNIYSLSFKITLTLAAVYALRFHPWVVCLAFAVVYILLLPVGIVLYKNFSIA
eukprot:Colp12_sorted_trinity150504_noHs@21556